jgi:hypothetical protein
MLWRAASRCAKDDVGTWVGVMTAERVDFFALAIGCAIAGCWSMVSGAVVVMALRAFGRVAG